MYSVFFNDRIWGKTLEYFDNEADALEFWHQFEDTVPGLYDGRVVNCETGEVLRELGGGM